MCSVPDEAVARLQVEISDELKQRLKIAAVRQDRTMSELCEEAIEAYLKKVEAKQ
jgi:predicted DNA-binding protein